MGSNIDLNFIMNPLKLRQAFHIVTFLKLRVKFTLSSKDSNDTGNLNQ